MRALIRCVGKLLVSAFISNRSCEAVTSESWVIGENVKKVREKNANFQGWCILAHFWPPKIDLFGHKWNNLEVFNLVSKKITKFATKPSKIDILVLLLYGATYFTPNFFIIVNIHAKHDVLKVQPLFCISLLLSKKKNFDFCKRRLILPHWLF